MGTLKKKKAVTLPTPSPTTLLKAQLLIAKIATKRKGHKQQPNFTKASATEDKQLFDDLATEQHKIIEFSSSKFFWLSSYLSNLFYLTAGPMPPCTFTLTGCSHSLRTVSSGRALLASRRTPMNLSKMAARS